MCRPTKAWELSIKASCSRLDAAPLHVLCRELDQQFAQVKTRTMGMKHTSGTQQLATNDYSSYARQAQTFPGPGYSPWIPTWSKMYAIKLNAFNCCVFRCRWVWLVGPMLSLWSQKRPNLCLQNLARLPDRWMFKTVRLGSLKRFLILQVHRVDDKRWSKWGTIAAKWWHNVDT